MFSTRKKKKKKKGVALLRSQQHIKLGATKGEIQRARQIRLMGIGVSISSCVFINEGNASVLGRPSMSRGISGVTGSGSSDGSACKNR